MDYVWSLLKVIGLLAVIIALFLITMKFVATRQRQFLSGKAIRPVGGLVLGQNKSVQVVQIGSTLYILGVGNDVQLVAKIEDPEEISRILEQMTPVAGTGSIVGWFKRFGNHQSGREDEFANTPSFQSMLQERLYKLANRQQRVEDMLEDQFQDERLNDKP